MQKTILALLIALAAGPAAAQQKLDFILNWVPGGDHAPTTTPRNSAGMRRKAST